MRVASGHFAELDRTGGVAELVVHAREFGGGMGALDYLVQSPAGARLAGDLPMVGTRRGWMQLTALDPDETEAGARLCGAIAGRRRRGRSATTCAACAGRTTRCCAPSPCGIAVTILLGGAGGIWLSRMFLHRVDAMTRAAEAIIDGDLNQRIPLRGTADDLDRLAETLNRMLDRMDKLLDQRPRGVQQHRA